MDNFDPKDLTKPTIMPFGKYSGSRIEDIPSQYLKWFCENIKPDSKKMEELIKQCDSEYQFRDKYDLHFKESPDE